MHHSLLEKIQIFQNLPESEVKALLEAGMVESYPAGSIILNERDQPQSLYIVLEGRAEAFLPKTTERITAVRLCEIPPGHCFAEYAFVDQQPASASIRASTDALVFCIGYETLHTLLEAKVLRRLYLTTVLRVISGEHYATMAKGKRLDIPYDFELAALYLDEKGPDGVQQLLQVFDLRD